MPAIGSFAAHHLLCARLTAEYGDSPVDADAPTCDAEWNGPDSGIKRFLNDAEYPDYLAEIASRDQFDRAVRDPVRTVVSREGWKLNLSPAGEHELYDLNADPVETTNLAARPGSVAAMRDLAARLRTWQQRTGDGVALPPFD